MKNQKLVYDPWVFLCLYPRVISFWILHSSFLSSLRYDPSLRSGLNLNWFLCFSILFYLFYFHLVLSSSCAWVLGWRGFISFYRQPVKDSRHRMDLFLALKVTGKAREKIVDVQTLSSSPACSLERAARARWICKPKDEAKRSEASKR